MSNMFKWCGKIAPKASIPELVQNMCSFIGGDGLKNLILEMIKKYGEDHPISDAVDKYFEDNPVGPVIEENVEKYFEDNPLEPAVEESVENYFDKNPLDSLVSEKIDDYFITNPIDTAVNSSVDNYFESNPIQPVVQQEVNSYFSANPIEPVINTAVASSINEYFRENPISDDISKAIQEYFEQNPVGGFDLDKVFPVGSIYATEDNEFDPNVAWGGTWETLPGLACLRNKGESGEFVIDQSIDGAPIYDKYEISAGEFKEGSASVRLKESQIPKHTHKLQYSKSVVNNKIIKHATGSLSNSVLTSMLYTSANISTDEGPDVGTYPLVSNVPIMNTPTYGVVYWRRTA